MNGTPQSLPLEGSAVLNDRPVACQTRGPTDPQGDRWHGEAVTDEVSPPAGGVPHTPAASAATYPLRRFAPQWARFDNRPNCPAHQLLPSLLSAAAAQEVQAIPRTDNVPRRANSAKPAAPNLHLPAPRKEVLKRSFKWRFWLLLSPETKVTRARKRETSLLAI